MRIDEEQGGTAVDIPNALSEISSGLGFNADSNQDAEPVKPEPTTEAVRDATGRFASPAPTTAPAASATTAAPAISAAPTPGPADTTAPPKTWRSEASALYATLPPQVQAEIHKREEDMFRGLEQYKGAANFGSRMHGAMQQFLPLLQQFKIDPAQQVGSLMQAHHTLALGSQPQKIGLMVKMLNDYRIPLDEIIRAVDPANAPYVDPAVANLTSTVQTLQSQLAQQNQQRVAEVTTNLSKQISSFAADPKNVHFNDVASDMTRLIEQGVCGTLEDAYEKAIWMNPIARAKEADKLANQRLEAQRTAAEAAAAAARKATGANVRTTQKRGSATAPVGSIDDTLRETMAVINSRG
jgi:hypothetical protein